MKVRTQSRKELDFPYKLFSTRCLCSPVMSACSDPSVSPLLFCRDKPEDVRAAVRRLEAAAEDAHILRFKGPFGAALCCSSISPSGIILNTFWDPLKRDRRCSNIKPKPVLFPEILSDRGGEV